MSSFYCFIAQYAVCWPCLQKMCSLLCTCVPTRLLLTMRTWLACFLVVIAFGTVDLLPAPFFVKLCPFLEIAIPLVDMFMFLDLYS